MSWQDSLHRVEAVNEDQKHLDPVRARRSHPGNVRAISLLSISVSSAVTLFLAERVGFEPRPYSRFLKTETRVHFSNIFIFLSAVYYVYPVSVVSLVLV